MYLYVVFNKYKCLYNYLRPTCLSSSDDLIEKYALPSQAMHIKSILLNQKEFYFIESAGVRETSFPGGVSSFKTVFTSTLSTFFASGPVNTGLI